MGNKNFWPTALTAAVTAGAAFFASGCAEKYYAVSGGNGGIRLMERGEPETLAFTPLSELNYLIPGGNGYFYYGSLSQLPDTLKKTGGVVVLQRQSDGRFSIVKTVTTEGAGTCHLALSPDGRHLYTANYSAGTITELPVIYGVPRVARLIYHIGHGKTARQKSPHPHFVGFDPRQTALFAADLGTDEIRIYDWMPGQGVRRKPKEILKLHPGAGPRHLAFDPGGKVLYSANELDSTVTSFAINPQSGKWEKAVTCPTLEKGVSPKNNYPGAIRTFRNGRFLVVTNRGHNSIALFETDRKGGLRLIGTFPSGGDYPSDIQPVNGGRSFLVAHKKSGTITHLDFHPLRKELKLRRTQEKAPDLQCLLPQ